MEILDLIEAYYSPVALKPADGSQAGAISPVLDFELPVWDDREVKRTPVSPEALLQRSEAFLALRNAHPDAAKHRLEKKCRVEFQL